MSDLLLAIFTGFGLFMTLAGFLAHLSYRLGKLEVKIETMWVFQMRRATSEVIHTGTGTLNSPLIINEAAKALLNPIQVELRQLWNKKWSKLKETDVLLDIERKFGATLMTLIGIPYGMTQGASLLIALAVAKETSTVQLTHT